MREVDSGDPMKVGNLDSSRDYTDVRDVVVAYQLLLELPTPRYSVFNICSGEPRSGWEILEAICSALGKPAPSVELSQMRAIDPSVVRGSSQRLQDMTGWRPTIGLDTSIADFVAWFEQRL
jgi:GDP-4-dehydro-6-deoxy-D-mannose reductase